MNEPIINILEKEIDLYIIVHLSFTYVLPTSVSNWSSILIKSDPKWYLFFKIRPEYYVSQ